MNSLNKKWKLGYCKVPLTIFAYILSSPLDILKDWTVKCSEWLQERNMLCCFGGRGFARMERKWPRTSPSAVTPGFSACHEGEEFNRLYGILSGPTILETSDAIHLLSGVRNHGSLLTGCICVLLSCSIGANTIGLFLTFHWGLALWTVFFQAASHVQQLYYNLWLNH